MYNREKYDEVKAQIENNRLAALAEAERREVEIHAASPEVAEIDLELRQTSMKIFKAAVNGEDITPLKERNLALNAKRKELIRALGYPEDYTSPPYSCPKCSDTGYVNRGSVVCSCLKEALIKASIAASGIGNLIERQSFDNFNLGLYKNDQKALAVMTTNVEIAKDFVKNFREKGGNILMLGMTGTGKTHISTAIAREIIKQGFYVVYDSVQNIVSDFESDKFRNAYIPAENKSDKYLECDLLIIDDLGTEFSTAFTISCIYNLINTRQNRGLSTIVSTNLQPEELNSRYEDRIFSRLVGKGYTVLSFVGEDARVDHLRKKRR